MKKILIIEDDPCTRMIYRTRLQAEGFATRVYSDGAAALKALVENPPDLAVCDIKMPRMDGFELLRRLRETPGAAAALPVIFLTSKDDELDEALGLAMGADDYIAKPFSQRLLIARIRAILRRTEPSLPTAEGGEQEPSQQLVRGRQLTGVRQRVGHQRRPEEAAGDVEAVLQHLLGQQAAGVLPLPVGEQVELQGERVRRLRREGHPAGRVVVETERAR
jgi:DNA-binding response OmpR family regulator